MTKNYYKQYCKNCRHREVLIDDECGFFNVCLMDNEIGKPCNDCDLIDEEKIKEFQERFGGDSE